MTVGRMHYRHALIKYENRESEFLRPNRVHFGKKLVSACLGIQEITFFPCDQAMFGGGMHLQSQDDAFCNQNLPEGAISAAVSGKRLDRGRASPGSNKDASPSREGIVCFLYDLGSPWVDTKAQHASMKTNL